jgi:hypothetical protein
MSFEYSIEHASPDSAHADLLRLWWQNLPVAQESADAKYRWLYRDAPQPGGVFMLKARRAGEPERVVGTAGVGCRRFFANGRPARAALIGDVAVDQDHRTLLPAMRLIRQVREAALAEFDFAYAYPNRSAEGVFVRCGYRKLGPMARFAAVLRHEPYLRQVLRVPVLPRIAGAGLDLVRSGLRAPRVLWALGGHRLEWLGDVDERFDGLWERARTEYGLIGQRDAGFLRWRFLRHPTERFQIAALVRHDHTRALDAYAVIELQERTAHVRDLFGHLDGCGKLLDLLLPALRDRGASNVSMEFLGASRIVQLLRSRGFQRRASERAIIVQSRDGDMDAAGLAALTQDAERLHLTDADEDT